MVPARSEPVSVRFDGGNEQHFNGSSPDADSNDPARISLGQLRALQYQSDANLGHQINAVSDSRNALAHTVVGTLMRVDLLEPLRRGDDVELRIDFEYNIVNGDVLSPRGGYEHFRKMKGTVGTISLLSRSGSPLSCLHGL